MLTVSEDTHDLGNCPHGSWQGAHIHQGDVYAVAVITTVFCFHNAVSVVQ